mmetsp:Transcript_24796/g.86331  ORF Transcript_24796/g.86331 Transcript_24796/m.86331 type:complete len:203 (+) Transcript_24796:1707-2315(+)
MRHGGCVRVGVGVFGVRQRQRRYLALVAGVVHHAAVVVVTERVGAEGIGERGAGAALPRQLIAYARARDGADGHEVIAVRPLVLVIQAKHVPKLMQPLRVLALLRLHRDRVAPFPRLDADADRRRARHVAAHDAGAARDLRGHKEAPERRLQAESHGREKLEVVNGVRDGDGHHRPRRVPEVRLVDVQRHLAARPSLRQQRS